MNSALGEVVWINEAIQELRSMEWAKRRPWNGQERRDTLPLNGISLGESTIYQPEKLHR